MAAMMRSLSSCLDATRMWRSTERASLEKKPSTRLSQEPCLGVKMNSNRPVGCSASQALVSCGQADDTMPRRIGAEAWFDRWEAQKYDVYEQTVRTGDHEILTLVLITDSRMLEEK